MKKAELQDSFMFKPRQIRPWSKNTLFQWNVLRTSSSNTLHPPAPLASQLSCRHIYIYEMDGVGKRWINPIWSADAERKKLEAMRIHSKKKKIEARRRDAKLPKLVSQRKSKKHQQNTYIVAYIVIFVLRLHSRPY